MIEKRGGVGVIERRKGRRGGEGGMRTRVVKGCVVSRCVMKGCVIGGCVMRRETINTLYSITVVIRRCIASSSSLGRFVAKNTIPSCRSISLNNEFNKRSPPPKLRERNAASHSSKNTTALLIVRSVDRRGLIGEIDRMC